MRTSQYARVATVVLVIVLTTTPGLTADVGGSRQGRSRGAHSPRQRPARLWRRPPGFRFDDCKTQRNLDDRGRLQARALGAAFRQQGIRVDRIVASPMCRCLETGQLMAVGSVETSWDLLPDTGGSRVRLQRFKEMVAAWSGPGTLVVVTHALTISPLTGLTLQQAETLVLQPAPGSPHGGTVVGRIAPPR
jgi:phosphohistidine phosphatase SixA